MTTTTVRVRTRGQLSASRATASTRKNKAGTQLIPFVLCSHSSAPCGDSRSSAKAVVRAAFFGTGRFAGSIRCSRATTAAVSTTARTVSTRLSPANRTASLQKSSAGIANG